MLLLAIQRRNPALFCCDGWAVPLQRAWKDVLTTCLCLQFVADGVFYAELNELFTRELAEHGYSGVEVRVTPLRTEIIIRATRTQNVLGELEVLEFLTSDHL
jgi:hypothetical protein